jgi:hypothetical protein
LGVKQTNEIPKIKRESLKILNDKIILDEVKSKNKNIISNNLTSETYNEINKDYNEIVEKIKYLDDNGKIVKEKNIEFIKETHIDELGVKQIKEIPKIKRESLKILNDKIILDEVKSKNINTISNNLTSETYNEIN